MENTTRPLEADERLSDIEKILLITGHINILAFRANTVLGWRKESPLSEKEFGKELIKDTEEMISEMVTTLNEIREELADFISGCDALGPIDVQISKPIFDAINNLVSIYDEGDDVV